MAKPWIIVFWDNTDPTLYFATKEEFDNFVAWYWKFWDDVNYTEFEDNWTLVQYWEATTFEDLQSNILSLKVAWTGITENSSHNTVDFATNANLSDWVYGNIQMPHSWKIGSTIYPHIHWEQIRSWIPNWLVQYRRQKNWWAKTTTWTNYVLDTNAYTYTSWELNQITHNDWLVPPTGAWLSDVVEFRLYRDTANASWLFAWADPHTETARVTFFDVHFERDTLWSNEEYIK